MDLQKNKIEKLKSEGYTLKFENLFNQIFENYKKIALYAGLILFVFGILLITAIYGGLLSYFGIETITEMTKPENLNPANFSKEFLMIYTAFAILFTCLISPFSAGFIKMAYCADHDEEFRLSTIFSYYHSTKFFTLFITTLIIALVNNGISTSAEYFGFPVVGTVLTMLISFYALLTVPLIIFSNLGIFESIQTSMILVSKQPTIIIGLCTVSIIATLVGMLLFIIGIIFTLPFIYSFYYILYKEVVGFEN
ncbi:hypothetical protein [Flavobacterium sp. 7A]|uniref:hypothetical protein n=1 Tax=Flavobacterium sp. 7A TaxID=2940571 RepID=UPI002226BFBB|nr:hypothetical protein [Flavobacterium sp. 7A]MCW2119630.1 putative membrane protein [Flavobacterium sp. 7A]